MPVLTDEIKEFIVKGLACYDTPSQVAEAVRANFEIEVSRQQVHEYDPACRRRPAQRWIDLHAATRAALLRDAAEIGVAHKMVRLRMLDRLAHRCERNGVKLAIKCLEQAAKECGGMYENRRPVVAPIPAPQQSVPQPSVPQQSAPEPAAQEPAAPQPAATRQPVSQPAAPEIAVPMPVVPPPPAPQQSVSQPSAPKPAEPRPVVPQSSAPRQSMPQPSASKPAASQPIVLKPSALQPPAPQPPAPQPPVQAAPAPQPGVLRTPDPMVEEIRQRYLARMAAMRRPGS